jgi:hypothetical protein
VIGGYREHITVFSKRRRKTITPFILAVWVFALLASVAHACGLDEAIANAVPSVAAQLGGHDGSDSASPACKEFCSDDSPLLAKLKTVQDPPTGEAVIVPILVGGSSQTAITPVSSPFSSPDPPPGLAVNTRFVRLAL